MRIERIDESWDRFDRVLDLIYIVLYRDFGVAPESEWYVSGEAGSHVVALSHRGGLLGVARLMGRPGDESRQLRQVAVEPAVHGTGVGRALVTELERIAAEEGAREVVLNARDTAIPFYERLGYIGEGDLFVSELTGIPHRFMRKRLTSV